MSFFLNTYSYLANIKNNVVCTMKQLHANHYIKERTRQKRNNNQRIRVGFIVQMPEVWDKEAPIYEGMERDERFEPFLLIAPAYDFSSSSIGEYGEEYLFFSSRYKDSNIIPLYDGKWIDISKKRLDYVFYQRCWEHYLPEQYHAKNVIRYAKTCYVPYDGVSGVYNEQNYYKSDFFIYLYRCFCSTTEEIKLFPQSRQKKNVFLGVPVLEAMIRTIERDGKERTGPITILWTPRWTNDQFGGSTFIKNMYNILELKNMEQIKLVLRPHPLTFPNCIKEKLLSQDEVQKYKKKVVETGAVFDSNKIIADTLVNTDILITDFSSIILPFFLTGKPIIYCGDTNVQFDKIYTELLKGIYCIHEWAEIEACVTELAHGNDRLKEERKGIIQSILSVNQGATERILDYIYEDYIN